MSTQLEIPIIHKKVKYPFRWFMGLIASGILMVGTTTAIRIINQQNRQQDISKLTIPVSAKDITVMITRDGKVQPIENVNISPKNSGFLAELNVEQGDKVTKGQIIARMDNSDIQMRIVQHQANLKQAKAQLAEIEAGSRPEDIAQAKARLAQAEAQLTIIRAGNRNQEIDQARAAVDAAKAQLELTESRLQRYQGLAKEGAVSQDSLDQYISENKRAGANLQEAQRRLSLQKVGNRNEDIRRQEAVVAQEREALRKLQNGNRPEQIAQAKAAVAAAQAQLKQQQIQLQDTIIRAPFTGIITQKYASIGAFVTPTTSASNSTSATSSSIVALAQGVQVLVPVPDYDIASIKEGQKVEIIADAFPEQVFTGRVRLISPEAVQEQGVTSFQVRVMIDSGIEKLRLGLNVTVSFLGDRIDNTLTIPSVAIISGNNKTCVLMPDENNKPYVKEIITGVNLKNETQVLQGIKEGDLIFMSPPKDYKLGPNNNDNKNEFSRKCGNGG